MSISDVYGAFVDYYGDIPLKQIRTESGFEIYACKISSGLSLNRYIFVVSPVAASTSQQSFTPLSPAATSLNKLNWVSFQTRTTDESHDVNSITHFITPDLKTKLSDSLNIVSRDPDSSSYSCSSLPINIKLIHDMKLKNIYQFPDACKLYQALESYKCVVEIM